MTHMPGWLLMLWPIGFLGALVYCVVKAVADFRARRYFWGCLGLASAAMLALTPIEAQRVTIDLPAPR